MNDDLGKQYRDKMFESLDLTPEDEDKIQRALIPGRCMHETTFLKSTDPSVWCCRACGVAISLVLLDEDGQPIPIMRGMTRHVEEAPDD